MNLSNICYCIAVLTVHSVVSTPTFVYQSHHRQ